MTVLLEYFDLLNACNLLNQMCVFSVRECSSILNSQVCLHGISDDDYNDEDWCEGLLFGIGIN